jgi:hypothetical protein
MVMNKVRIDSMTISYQDVYVILSHFSREELRRAARQNGIRVGRNKSDTIRHLAQARIPLDIELPSMPLWSQDDG